MIIQRTFDAGPFWIEISIDKLTATLGAHAGQDFSAPAVIAKLKEIGIATFDAAKLLESLKSRKREAVSLVVARGTAAIDDRASREEFHVSLSDAQNGLVAKVTEDHRIAKIGPTVAGSDGRDVFGNIIPPRKYTGFTAGTGVSHTNGTFTATAAGNARARFGVITIHPLLEVYADDETLKAPVNFQGDISIRSKLSEGRNVEASGCMIVGGEIDAASFKVGEWLNVNGAIIGREKGAGSVGTDLWCRSINGGKYSVGGDVHVQSEIANSRVSCTGRLLIERGSIVGGKVTANGGITAQTLGNQSGTPTLVEAGIDQNLRLKLLAVKAEMDSDRKRAAEIRAKVDPLMKQLRNLTAQQKEKATELLYEADELEEGVKHKMSSLAEPCAATAEKSCDEIVVNQAIHAGVVIRFSGVETVINTTIAGPVRIVTRKRGRGIEIVAETTDGEIQALASTPIVDHFRPAMERLIAERKAA